MKDPMSFSLAVAICSNLDTDRGKFTDAEIRQAVRVIMHDNTMTDAMKWTPKKALWNIIRFLAGEL